MIVKWCAWGAGIGAVWGLFNGSILYGAFLGGILGIAIRKWLFRTFWK